MVPNTISKFYTNPRSCQLTTADEDAKVYWLLPSFLIYALAFGGVIVPKLELILALRCKEYLANEELMNPTHHNHTAIMYGGENNECRIPEVQQLVSNFMLYASLVGGILSAITSPKLGALSDRYGRTRMMACTSIGMVIGEIITIIAATYPETVSVWWILLGYACDGFCGSFTAGMAITNAYASDCTAPSRRSVAFAYFQGCLFTGIAFGPIISGYIVKYTGSLISIFYVVLIAHSLFLFTLLAVIPESLTKERQMAAREKSLSVGKAEVAARKQRDADALTYWGVDWIQVITNVKNVYGLFTPLSILWPTGEGTNTAVRRNLVFLAAVDTTMFGVAMGSMSITIIYCKYMYGWDTLQSSVFISSVNISRVSCLLILLPVVTRLVRGKPGSRVQQNTGCDQLDLWSIRTALIFDISGYIGYTLSRSGNVMILSGVLAAVGGIGSPTLQSSLTKHVPEDRTGQLLGAVGLLHALARIVSPVIFNTIYTHTVATFPQTVFICLAATFGIGFVLSWFIRPNGEHSCHVQESFLEQSTDHTSSTF